ncbi:hypothetical protein BT96DRAFT_1024008 [Gymnopus androsaceus JB14]|uniref:Uncharacterized protein n=1 Tax=Gymnopus androsaceus JB14 TaxID=1447944 RepID=A0A6A4H087_9AGAR|nr:hypothetical protein BT96DRAFT_1024008 [Gymnopus androsaceus JB14]
MHYPSRVESFNFQDESIYTAFTRRSSDSVSSRQGVISELLRRIRADEASAKQLLQAFDVELEKTVLSAHQTPFRSLTNSSHANSTQIPTEVTDALLPPSQSENPFLSTPLRSKYFPKLSPSILRQLLRSPSPHVYTPDSSFEVGNDVVDFSTSASLPSIPSLEFSADRGIDSSCEKPQASGLAYPLTPPSSARIPGVESHETPARMLHSPFELDPVTDSPGLYIEGIDDSVPDIRACLSSMTPFARTNNFRHSVRQTPSSTIPATRTFTLISSATRHSQCVADEIRAAGETPDERRVFFIPYKTARGTENHRSRKPGRIMDREFVELLEARAMEEEKDASELYMIAKRLEKLALQRRHLAAWMIKESKS